MAAISALSSSTLHLSPAGTARGGKASGDGDTALSPEQQRQVAELQQIDLRVRAHEAAHIAAGQGVVTSGARYSYANGPDGKRYAVAGEVSIDTRAEKQPEQNIDKGQRIQRAALAPADPSPQDRNVASVGAQLENRGRTDLVRQQQEADLAASQEAASPSDNRTETTAVNDGASPQAGQPLNSRLVQAYVSSALASHGDRVSQFA